MALRLTSALDPAFAGFDDIIDVRSPAEFAEDHLPGAINLSVLSDAERAKVGTIYKQVSPFDARKLGGALVSANAARHIAGPLSGHDGSWRPLIYCWRGGQRSGSFTTILTQIGWRAELVEGGYRSWRARVVERVAEKGFPSSVVVLDGNTGSAKTAILTRLAARGVQVIDLEGLANHRGSLFGAMPGGQPSQKMFEGRLAVALERLDPSRPVVVEAESSRIGVVNLPKAVWHAICDAPRIRLEVPASARAAYSALDYADVTQDAAQVVEKLRPLHAADTVTHWLDLADKRDWQALALGLMQEHYDPRYEKHRARYAPHEAAVIPLQDLSPVLQEEASARIEALLRQIIAEK